MKTMVKSFFIFAIALCLLAGTVSLTIFASHINCADCMCFSEVIGEGVREEADVWESEPAPVAKARVAVAPVAAQCEEAIVPEVIGEGAQFEAAVWESEPAPVMCEPVQNVMNDVPVVGDSSSNEFVVSVCEEESPFAIDEPISVEPIAIDIPAPPINQ